MCACTSLIWIEYTCCNERCKIGICGPTASKDPGAENKRSVGSAISGVDDVLDADKDKMDGRESGMSDAQSSMRVSAGQGGGSSSAEAEQPRTRVCGSGVLVWV